MDRSVPVCPETGTAYMADHRCVQCPNGRGCLSALPAPDFGIARAIYAHRCQFDLPADASRAELRQVAVEALEQGDLFAEVVRDLQS